MTQSANARPCNCDQALQSEAWLGVFKSALSKEETQHLATCAELDEANATLKAVARILCDLVNAPSLSVAQFADPTLERVRLAMLGRER